MPHSRKLLKTNGAKGGTRTPTPLRAPDPKSGASANSATFAPGWLSIVERSHRLIGFPSKMCFLVLQQKAFAPHSSPVARNRSVAADDAMAGNQDADPVVSVGAADSSLRSRAPDGTSLFRVGARLPIRNLSQELPGSALELGAGDDQGDGELSQISLEVEFEFLVELLEMLILAWQHCAIQVFLEAPNLRLQHAPIRELEQADPLFRGCCRHRAEGSQQARHHSEIPMAAASRRISQNAVEGVPEATQRLESMIVGHHNLLVPESNPAQSKSQTLSSLVGLEGYPVVLTEPAAHPTR